MIESLSAVSDWRWVCRGTISISTRTLGGSGDYRAFRGTREIGSSRAGHGSVAVRRAALLSALKGNPQPESEAVHEVEIGGYRRRVVDRGVG